ncbi:MAG: hypothetical protein FJX29_00950 [Alphaproteobacteria bacterium]|nr:hypothetical protein [Alphaproteobacteria bacterium]
MGILGKLFLLVLTPVIALAGYAAWLLLWPVNADNVASRAEHACYAAYAIKRVDGRNASRAGIGGINDLALSGCSCFARELIGLAGPELAGEIGEKMRAVIAARITKSQQAFRDLNRMSREDREKARLIEQAGVRAAEVCRG